MLTQHPKDVRWRKCVSFARDAAAGVLHLHYEHVVHRDIASRNLLLDENLSVAVSGESSAIPLFGVLAYRNPQISVYQEVWLHPTWQQIYPK